jgi:hypothetical protein
LLEILPDAQKPNFNKEDGTALIDAHGQQVPPTN